MMWKLNKAAALPLLALCCFACSPPRHKNNTYTRHPGGYYYQLLSFHADSACKEQDKIARLSATFRTQSDSIFWDSHNNLNDHFFIRTTAGENKDFLKTHVSQSCLFDSVCLLIPTRDFFRQQFNIDSLPFFSKTDSIVRINYRVSEVYSPAEFDRLCLNLRSQEKEQIKHYFGSEAIQVQALDPLGFYWINKPAADNQSPVETGDLVTISYEGSFVNGRFFEKSARNFDFIYGTPDQLLKGLNIVIGQLNLGQTAKILLPSRLAFGESGSSNGIVPPYTPLIYEIKIIEIKKTR